MAYNSDHTSLFSYLRRTINEISVPLEMCIDSYERKTGNRTFDNSQELIIGEFTLLLLRMSKADDYVSFDEVSLLKDFREEFNLDRDVSWSTYNQYMENYEFDGDYSKPVCVTWLEQYDKACGSDYAEKAKTMFYRLATAMTKADDEIENKEARFLRKFYEALHEPTNLEQEDDQPIDSLASTLISQPEKDESIDELINELNSLVGLNSVKNDVIQLVNFLKVQQMRQSKGMATVPISRHLVFYGNPGTGKTTVARLLARIYKSLGIISKGHLIETDRSGLVAGYIGQTAIKVRDVVTSALGGILFIDEAYALATEGQDYGQEAIDTLIKLMEDNRENLIVVVAGYPEKMGKFLAMNPGLKSRFNKYFNFEDYNPSQLSEIFQLFCKTSSYTMSNKAKEKASGLFQILHDVRDETFGNARLARNVFERTVSNQANRLADLSDVNEAILSTIEDVDLPGAVEFHTINSM